MPYVVGILGAVASFFLIILLFADVNPYEKLGFTPANGQGLNPQLQSYWMTIHPPMLYMGFTSFTVPFAFAIAALVSGRLDSRWINVTLWWFPIQFLFKFDAKCSLGCLGSSCGSFLFNSLLKIG